MRFLRVWLLPLALLAWTFSASAAETVLKVISPEKTLTFTAQDIAALPRTDLKLPAQGDQDEVSFSGVAVRELLLKAGAPLGAKMKGTGMTTGVIVRCKDNYAVLFALAEFDPSFSTRTILLADHQDGEILPPSAAPFRIVTPGDKRGARSCKQVVSIEIVSLAKP
jgi:DMSO/TMAO reductase YedYZ molybdopterin-dependent catalytic subunit